MDAVVLEKVKASELPAAWQKRLKAKPNETVTVTIAKAQAAKKQAKSPSLPRTRVDDGFGLLAKSGRKPLSETAVNTALRARAKALDDATKS